MIGFKMAIFNSSGKMFLLIDKFIKRKMILQITPFKN